MRLGLARKGDWDEKPDKWILGLGRRGQRHDCERDKTRAKIVWKGWSRRGQASGGNGQKHLCPVENISL